MAVCDGGETECIRSVYTCTGAHNNISSVYKLQPLLNNNRWDVCSPHQDQG